MLKRLIGVVALLWVLSPGLAWSECEGRDLLAWLHAEDPATASAVEARAAAVPNGEGVFWRVEKPGLEPSYLYGTHHASAGVRHVPDAAWQALDRARVAVFELSREDYEGMERRMRTDPSLILDPDAPRFAELMSPEDLEQVRLLYRARGIAIEAVERMQLWMQIALISFPPCQLKASARGEQGIDQVMQARAGAAGIPDFGLETPDEAIAAFSGLDRESIVAMIVGSARFREMEEDVFATAMDFYATGRTAMIYEFSMAISERLMPEADLSGVRDWMMGGLIEGRNAKWMPALLGHLAGGNAFIAVGALHLPGKGGLVELLRRGGYRLTRLH